MLMVGLKHGLFLPQRCSSIRALCLMVLDLFFFENMQSIVLTLLVLVPDFEPILASFYVVKILVGFEPVGGVVWTGGEVIAVVVFVLLYVHVPGPKY